MCVHKAGDKVAISICKLGAACINTVQAVGLVGRVDCCTGQLPLQVADQSLLLLLSSCLADSVLFPSYFAQLAS